MDETIIPWDFLGMLIVMGLLVLGITLCIHALKTRSRARLQDPRKDHIYKKCSSSTRKEQE